MTSDWRLLRSFVAVAEDGSMQQAARSTGLSQPTLSRHIKQLEDELGITLFDRLAGKSHLTRSGQSLYAHARSIRDAVDEFGRLAKGERETKSGPVRMMMHCMIGYHFAPSWIRELHEIHPEISIELSIDDRVNLLHRDIDIAIHSKVPDQKDIIAQKVGSFKIGLYASEAYLSNHPLGSLNELASHALIGFDEYPDWIQIAASLGIEMTRADFNVRADLWAAHPHLIKAGLGIGALPTTVAKSWGLSRVHDEVEIEGDGIYLLAHPDLKRNPVMRTVWDHVRLMLESQFNDGCQRSKST